jgi:hypothetical protein
MADIRGFTGQVVDYFRGVTAEDVRAQRAVIGPCPNGDGEIRENRRGYGCSSWRSAEEPGCGFVIWKTIKGRSVSPGEARDLLETGRTELLDGFRTRPSKGRLVLTGGQVQLVDEQGNRLDTPAAEREVIAACPRCGGEVKENNRAYGCSSWRSKTEPGCGFVIWKRTGGHDVTPEEARELIEAGRTGEIEFKERKSSYPGRLVLTPDLGVGIERADGKEPPATAPRRRAPDPPGAEPGSDVPAGTPSPRPAATAAAAPAAARAAVGVLERPAEPSTGDELLDLLAAQSVEVVDKRSTGGALWVVGGPELAELMDRLAARGFRFSYSKDGGRASKHRPAWWIK